MTPRDHKHFVVGVESKSFRCTPREPGWGLTATHPDAAAPGRLCRGRRGRHARSTDSLVGGWAAIICAVLTSLPAFRP